MILKTSTLVGVALALTAPAHAQNNDGPAVEPANLRPIATDIEAKALIGAPLDTAISGEDIEAEAEQVFVIDSGSIKSAGEWSAADQKACEDAGGVQLDVGAGRVACFQL